MNRELPELRPGVVYIWEGRLDVPDRVTAAARTLLSGRERKRADRFVYDRHRRRYTVAQAHLRRVLGQLTGTLPDRIRFHYEEKGKPFVTGGPSFNQSHSEDRLMIAVAASGRLGVDIEELRRVRLMLGIVDKNFAPDEAARMHTAPADERQELFFRIWTRKEAFPQGARLRADAPAEVVLGGSLAWRGSGDSCTSEDLPEGSCALVHRRGPLRGGRGGRAGRGPGRNRGRAVALRSSGARRGKADRIRAMDPACCLSAAGRCPVRIELAQVHVLVGERIQEGRAHEGLPAPAPTRSWARNRSRRSRGGSARVT